MIIHDEETLNEALQLLESSGPLRYSDEYAYVVVVTPETLESQCRRAFDRNDIVVVVPLGSESGMEDHAGARLSIRRRRAEDEKKAMKTWIREHPEVVEKIKKSLKKRKKDE